MDIDKTNLINRFIMANRAVRNANLFLEDFLGVAKFNNSDEVLQILSTSKTVQKEIESEGLEIYGQFDYYYQSWDSWIEHLKEQLKMEEI